MGKMDEQIIVVKRALLFGDGISNDLTFQGTEKSEASVAELEKRMAEYYEVMRRGDAEANPAYKQPIPYALLRRGNQYFTYERLGGGGEQRLHGKLSIGVGGHMNKVEGAQSFKQVLSVNLHRELNEELIINGAAESEIRAIGLINDDATDVGRVHIGLLVAIDFPESASVIVREKDKLEGKWLTLSELLGKETYGRLESWSAFAVDLLAKR